MLSQKVMYYEKGLRHLSGRYAENAGRVSYRKDKGVVFVKTYERFLKYVSYDTTSNEKNPQCPSTENQRVFAGELVKELLELGVTDARVDEHGYVYASIPQNCDTQLPPLGLIAHMDTSDAAPGNNIKPRIVSQYDGNDILLNEEKNIVLSPKEYPDLKEYVGQDIIVTDGTTLLGSDDKAGIAEIMGLVEFLQKENPPHRTICIAFTPDEEIGRGADLFDVEGFGAKIAYTLDGGKPGEIEYENFNAASADLTVHGLSIHPGSAKNKMKNAILLGIEFNSMLPSREIPENTEGYEGFHHLNHIDGCEELATLRYIIRDHSREKFEEKKAFFVKTAAFLNEKYGEGTFELKITDSYYNMREVLEEHMELVENVRQIMESMGITPISVPIRGGTDGSRLSYMGILCPNLCAGGANAHGRFEYVPIQSMDTIVELLKKIVAA